MSSRRPERIFVGDIASPGLAWGRIRMHAKPRMSVLPSGSSDEEARRLEEALGAASARLAELAAGAEASAAAILEFQIALIEDAELVGPVRQEILAGVPAAASWRRALDRQVAEYEQAEDSYFRARAADLADLRDRVLELLAGGGAARVESDTEDAIYIGEDLAPSRFLEIDWTHYRGGGLMRGSANSHVAILARALGIPLVTGLGPDAGELVSGAEAILDA